MHNIALTVLGVSGLLAIVSFLPAAARRLNLPFSVLLALTGCALGAVVASISSPLLGGLLVNVGPRDPLVLAAATLLVGLGTLLASAPPALRASRLEPQRVLKAE